MKEIILNFLGNKTNREFHSLNLLIKGNFKTKTREDVAEIKRMLRGIPGIEFTGLEQLDSINSNGHNSSYPNGMAMPTQYHDFDSVNVQARGLKDMSSVPKAAIPKIEPFVYKPVPKPQVAEAPKPVTALPEPSPLPVVEGHPIDVPDAVTNCEPVIVEDEVLSKNGVEHSVETE